MKVVRGYKTELDLNNSDVTECRKHAGAARFAYNWGLHRCQEEKEALLWTYSLLAHVHFARG